MWEAIGATAELLAALGVIASLVYVGRQFRHSSTTAIQAMNYENAHLILDNLENVSVWRRGCESWESLTDDELMQFTGFVYNQFSYLDYVYVQWQRRLVNQDLFKRAMRLVNYYYPLPGVRAYFSGKLLNFDHRSAFSPEFLDYLDREFPSEEKEVAVVQ